MRPSSQVTRDKILRAALELVAARGFQGASVARIAERAGVNVGSMYYHFSDKENIISALYLQGKARIAASAFRGMEGGASAEDQLKMVIGNVVRHLVDHPAEFSFVEQFENSPYFAADRHGAERAEAVRPYQQLHENLIEQGAAGNLSADVFESLFSGAVIALTKHFLRQGSRVDEGDLAAAVDAMWRMIATAKAGGQAS
jgi:AcrR family transcriptional regulator